MRAQVAIISTAQYHAFRDIDATERGECPTAASETAPRILDKAILSIAKQLTFPVTCRSL